MSDVIRPIPRRILALFLKDFESIKVFEQIQQNVGETIPSELQDLVLSAGSADAKATQALGTLERIAQSLELLASAPMPVVSRAEGFVPPSQEQALSEFFSLPIVDPEAPVYGGMHSNTPTVVAVAVAGTAYELTAGASAGLANLVTFGGSHYLQADRGGVFLVEWSMSVSAGAGDNIEAGIMVDGAAQTPGRADGNMGAAGSKHELSGQAFIRLSPLQQISLFVINQTAAVNISVDHMSCTITLIDRRVVT